MEESFGTRPFAFCIMSPRVTVAGKANRKGSRSESESEQGALVGCGGPEAHVFDELRIGAKDLSSWVIAGSLRNAFRGSVGQHVIRV